MKNNMIKLFLICALVYLTGCSHSSELREIRRTSDELYDLWWRSERWSHEISKEL